MASGGVAVVGSGAAEVADATAVSGRELNDWACEPTLANAHRATAERIRVLFLMIRLLPYRIAGRIAGEVL